MPPPASGRAVIAVVDVHTALGNVPIRPFPFFRRVARERVAIGLPVVKCLRESLAAELCRKSETSSGHPLVLFT